MRLQKRCTVELLVEHDDELEVAAGGHHPVFQGPVKGYTGSGEAAVWQRVIGSKSSHSAAHLINEHHDSDSANRVVCLSSEEPLSA